MQVKEIMTKNPNTCTPHTHCHEAAQKMRDDDVGSLPVCDDDGKCVGIITDRDIVCHAVAEGKNPSESKVKDCMSSDVHTCYEDDTIEKASEKMAKHQIRRLPIIDKEDKLIGIVALADVSKEGSQDTAAKALKGISQP